MATLATGLLASFDRTGLAPVGFHEMVSPTSLLVPPLPRLSQRDLPKTSSGPQRHVFHQRHRIEFLLQQRRIHHRRQHPNTQGVEPYRLIPRGMHERPALIPPQPGGGLRYYSTGVREPKQDIPP